MVMMSNGKCVPRQLVKAAQYQGFTGQHSKNNKAYISLVPIIDSPEHDHCSIAQT
jgi:hypothetical protein